jgi:hypothetical protein
MVELKKLIAEYEARRDRLQKQSEAVELTEVQRAHIAGQLAALRWAIDLPTKRKGENGN